MKKAGLPRQTTTPLSGVNKKMNKSESIKELAAALAKAQSQMGVAKKDAKNPYFKSSYATLASVWEACREPLTVNGLSITQSPETTGEGITLVTTLMHSSGEFVSGTLTMKPTKNDPQGIGSCITYARRYALAAVAGICVDDDDGNAACSKQQKSNTAQEENEGTVEQAAAPSRDYQLRQIFEKHSIDAEKALEWCGGHGIASFNEVPDEMFNRIKARPDAFKRTVNAGGAK